MFTSLFVRRAVERAIKTAAQAALLLLGADQLDWFDADWGKAATTAAAGFVVSLLTSIASQPAGDDPDSPSLVG